MLILKTNVSRKSGASANVQRALIMPVKLPKKLIQTVGKTLAEFDMLREGDRVLIGLSGGKDSFTLVHTLLHFKRHAPIHFDIGIATFDPQMDGFNPLPLRDYVAKLELPFHYVERPVQALAKTKLKNDSICAFCSRMRRGALYGTARDHNYNVLALGQHLDDIAESFLLSAFHEGKLNTMKAHYVNDAGDLRIIRPLIHVRERQLRDFAVSSGFPLILDKCIGEKQRTKRDHMKQLLSEQEAIHPQLFKSLKRALIPLMALTNEETK